MFKQTEFIPLKNKSWFAAYIMLSCLISFNLTYAQNTEQQQNKSGREIAVGGVVRDGATKKSIPFATVVVRDEANKLIENIPTDNSGMFKSFFQKNSNAYTVEIAMLGYDSVVKKIDIQSGKRYYNFGIIYLKPNTQLNTVYVTAPQLVRPSADGYIYDVAADSTAKKKKIAQLLARLPFMELNASNQPIYFGSNSRIRYLVNGKPEASLVDASVMKVVTGKKIKSIELVPNPPVSYANTDVIINIITENESKLFEGLLFTPNLIGNLSGFNYQGIPQGTLTASTHHFSYTANLSENYSDDYRKTKNSNLREKIVDNATPVPVLESAGKQNSSSNFPSIKGAVSWQISKKQSLAADYTYSHRRTDSHSLTDIHYYLSGAESNSIYSSIGKNTNYSTELTYNNGEFKKRDFMISYLYRYSKGDANSNSNTSGYYSGNPSSSSASKRDNTTRERLHLFYTRFNIPVTKTQSAAFTGSYSFDNNKNNNAAYVFDENTNLWNETSGFPQILNNKIQEGLFTASYTFALSKSLKLSLSGKVNYYNDKGNFTTDTYSDVSYHSFHFLPSAKFTWIPRAGYNITFIYYRDAFHPRIDQLNPLVDDSNPLYVNSGNPNLKDSKSDNAVVNYMMSVNKIMFSVNLAYTYTADAINLFSTLGNDGVTHTTYKNIGVSNNIAARMIMRYSFSRNFRTTLNLTLQHNMCRADTTRRTNTISPSLAFDYKINRLTTFGCSFLFSPVQSLAAQQTKVHYNMSSIISLTGNSKDMRLNYQIMVTNFTNFKMRRTEKSTTEYRGSSTDNSWYRVSSKRDIAGLMLGFSISYVFGHASGENR
jgi:hypothetical protein